MLYLRVYCLKMTELKASLSGTSAGFFLNQRVEKLTTRLGAGPNPNQLPEDHRLFVRKEEEERTARISLAHSIAWRLCADAHLSQASRKYHRTSSHNGGISSDTTLSLVIAALLPRGLEPTLITDFQRIFML